MTCFQCGAPVPEGSRFCSRCGMQISDPRVATLIVAGAGGEAELERLRMVFAGEYDVERELGRGGMGVIYRATELALARPVALKVLAPGLGTTLRSTERFRREARVVAELEHPNIVPVYRVGQLGGVLYIAMKLVDGRSLDSILQAQGPLTVPVALYVLRAASRALAYAHQRAIVHRDIKSANLLVDHDGRVLVTDFGVALHAADITLTEAGAVIGTPAFMSPEQCAGLRAGPPSDQYALGIVAFELLTGGVPFDSDTVPGFINHHLHTPVPDLRRVRDDLPESLVTLVERLLAKMPEERFATSIAMVEAIEALPFSEHDRRGSEETLRKLARGAQMPRVPSRALPKISDATTLVVSKPRLRARPWRRAAALAGFATAALATGAILASGSIGAKEPRRAEPLIVRAPITPSTADSDSAIAEPAPVLLPDAATIRLHTIPAHAEILVDGRVVGVGSAIDVSLGPGNHRVQAQARGYAPFDTTIGVASGDFVNLGRINLAPRSGRP